MSHKVLKSIAWLSCLYFITIGALSAQQSNFSKVEQDESYSFNYQWQDQLQNQQNISFSLPKKALFSRFRNFKAYKAEFAEQYVAQQIRRKLMESPIPNVQVNFRKQRGKITLDIKSTDAALIGKAYEKIAKMEQELTTEFLKQNHYQTFTTYDNTKGIKPNHRAIAQATVMDLKPLREPILNKVSIKNIRKVTDYTLGFVQSIPYSALESRISSSGAGFSTPLKLLWENQGDCDSKVTLTGALLRTLMPRVKIIFIFIEQHALIGIDVPARAGETSIAHNGTNYLLAEPTGPASLLLGKIAPQSKLAIDNKHYIVEEFF